MLKSGLIKYDGCQILIRNRTHFCLDFSDIFYNFPQLFMCRLMATISSWTISGITATRPDRP
jgi:hypothetical protein